MTRLPELFDAASSAPPASRYTVDDVLCQARRRRRLTGASAAATVALALVTGIGLVNTGAGGGISETPPPGPLRWVGRGDAQHLYLVTDRCDRQAPVAGTPTAAGPTPPLSPSNLTTPPPTGSISPSAPSQAGPSIGWPPVARPDCPELYASADGGATWVSRGSAYHRYFSDLKVLGPTVLARYAGTNDEVDIEGSPMPMLVELSVDGGAHWTVLDDGDEPLRVAPERNRLPFNDTGVTDPANRRIGKLLADPGYEFPARQQAPLAAGLWVAGTDQSPLARSISVSHDGGATWTHARLDTVTSPDGTNDLGAAWYPVVATRDGQRAFALAPDIPRPEDNPDLIPPQTRVYLTTNGGVTWTPTAAAPVLGAFSSAWATSDGRLVVCDDTVSGRTRTACKVSADGAHFVDVVLPGLPPNAVSTDGSAAMTDHAMFTSDDGFGWHEVWHD
jgi:hypothetical protein